jgi:hypothetical protein
MVLELQVNYVVEIIFVTIYSYPLHYSVWFKFTVWRPHAFVTYFSTRVWCHLSTCITVVGLREISKFHLLWWEEKGVAWSPDCQYINIFFFQHWVWLYWSPKHVQLGKTNYTHVCFEVVDHVNSLVMAQILAQNGYHWLMAVYITKNTMYLMQNMSDFCNVYCSGKWLLTRFQRVYVCSICLKTRRAIYQLICVKTVNVVGGHLTCQNFRCPEDRFKALICAVLKSP